MGIIEELKHSFKKGDSIIKLIYINAAVFVVVNLVKVLAVFTQSGFYSPIMEQLMMPAHTWTFLTRPWTIFSYMFLHEGFLHILFNLLWLYWIGMILVDFMGSKRVTVVYLLGGISGALLYIVAYNLIPLFNPTA
ncbi:MAG: rhomboid family intramembrane serine protease, partial [Bacteroidales bacterium]